MNDVVTLQIITSIFWLIVIVLVIAIFHRELKTLMSALVSLNIAGAHFELRDRKATLESYAILSDILVDLLSDDNVAKEMVNLISDHDAGRLTKFAVRYVNEVAEEEQDIAMLKGVGWVLTNRTMDPKAKEIYDAILKRNPNDSAALSLKGIWLLNSHKPEDAAEAERIYDELIKYSSDDGFRLNRAMAKAHVGKFDEAFAILEDLIQRGYLDDPDMLEYRPLVMLENARPEQFAQLRAKVEGASTKQA